MNLYKEENEKKNLYMEKQPLIKVRRQVTVSMHLISKASAFILS